MIYLYISILYYLITIIFYCNVSSYSIIIIYHIIAYSQEFGAVDDMRIRVMPVLGTSPAIFGQSMASYVLCQVAGKSTAKSIHSFGFI